MHANRPLSKWAARKRWKMLTGLGAAALALHAVLLGGLELAWPGGETYSSVLAAQPMEVRTLAAPIVDASELLDVPMASAPAAPSVLPKPRAVVAQVAHSPRTVRAVGAVSAPVAAPFPTPVALALPADESNALPAQAAPLPVADTLLALEATPTAAPKAVASPDPQPADEVVPVYRTRVPPAATLRFRMQRGGLHGTADLTWRPTGSRYELHFDGKVAGLTILTQVSSGGIAANGLAPVRFTDQRLRHAPIAANFQRDAGKITFSGPSDEFPLWPGVQDRLSWMIQLSAIVQADAKLAQPGAKVAMHVVGARADAGVWVFRCVARESVDAAGVAVQAAKFVREPRGPYDTAAEVWLDPQRHDLPVRAALRSGDGDALELVLQEANTTP
ncbi:hypothetical protein BH11PSE8_BH11PSE8_13120 [soil metagenome]